MKVNKIIGLSNVLNVLASKNTCKSCAFGMGGQIGGMRNELGQFPSVCKKAFQVQLSDVQAPMYEKIFK